MIMWPGKMWSKLLPNGSTKNNNNNALRSTDIDEQQQEGGMPIMQPSVNSDHNSDAGDTFHTPPASPAKQQQQSTTPKQNNFSTEQNDTEQSTQHINSTQHNNTTTALINNDLNMVGRAAAAATVSTATAASTNATQVRHDDIAVDEATAQLNNLSPYKPRVAHSPMKSPPSQPATKKPRPTSNTSVPLASTNTIVDNSRSDISNAAASLNLPEVSRNVDTTVFEPPDNPDNADISQMNPTMSPRTFIKGERKAPEERWHTWDYSSSGGVRGGGRGRGRGRGRHIHNGNCCNRSSTSNQSTTARGTSNNNSSHEPFTQLNDMNPQLQFCQELGQELDADEIGDASLEEFDVTGLMKDGQEATEEDCLEVMECFDEADRGEANTNDASRNGNVVNNGNWIPTHCNNNSHCRHKPLIPIEQKYKGFLLDRCQSIRCNGGESIGNRRELNHEESVRVHGQHGMLANTCRIWNKSRPRYGNVMKEGDLVEDLQTYTCDAEGCNVELKLARVQGGLLLYKKEDPQNPGHPYTHINHELPPKQTKKTTEYSLSVKQKEEILMRCGNETISNIVHDMVQSTKVPTTDAQSTDVHQFTLAAQGFARRKGKYFMHEYNHKPFTTNQTSEILNELMQDAPKQKWSNLNEFMGTSLFKTMTERVKVLEHNFQSDGVKDVVFFESKQAAEVVRLAGLMFEGENKGAIQFSCDFTHIPGTDFVLGICGVDDFNHRFWPTSFIVCPTESGEMAKKVMGRMVDLINLDVNGVKDKVLIDGANALHSACIELGIDPRSCFTHIIRMPLSRGGGKVGSKGSFANYLIKTMKVSHSNTAKIVGDAMLANFIPPKDKKDFESFINLMRDRHHDKLVTKQEKNEAQREHVYNTYLSHNPLRLGGRGAGIPGQSGSNNGGEIRGGNIKKKWRHVTKKCSKEAKKSVVYIVGAVAMDLMMCPNLNDTKKGFAYKPVRDESDYGLLRRISKFNLDGDDNALLPHDVQYMICTEYGSHTVVANPNEVIGNGNVSCSFQLPTASRVLTSLRQMEESTNISADSWLENSVVDVTSTANSYQSAAR